MAFSARTETTGGRGISGSGGSGGRSQQRLSHSLTWALRHQAPSLGLTMTPDGYVPVQELLDCSHPKLRCCTSLAEIQEIVRDSNKRRFRLEERPAALYRGGGGGVSGGEPSTGTENQQSVAVLCIRANQGHSIKAVDPELLLERLEPEQLAALPMVVHGTHQAAWQGIQRRGLDRMLRNHIHFASGLPQDDGVVSGMRKSCEIYIYADAAKCARDGIAFYRSDNGVLLTAGTNDEGVLPPKYFLRVTENSGNELSYHQLLE